MALNPYTLNHLYEKGIIEYVPTDLIMPTPMGTMMPMTNPYLNMAQQGSLYQNSINANDTFQMTSGLNTQSYPLVNSQTIGLKSNAGGLNTFNGVGVGANSNYTSANAFGMDGQIGALSNATIGNTFLGTGVGTNSNVNTDNIFGVSVKDGLSKGINGTMTVMNNTPKVILGILACIIGVAGIKRAFRFGKKPAKINTGESFWSKLNPMNWFRKKS